MSTLVANELLAQPGRGDDAASLPSDLKRPLDAL